MEYCGTAEKAQGSKVVRQIFEKPETLRCDAEVIREFKREYFVKHANEELIDKASLLGFAQRLDMLYAGANALGMNVVSSTGATGSKSTGLVPQQKPQKANETPSDLQKLVEKIERLESLSGPRGGPQNQNWRQNANNSARNGKRNGNGNWNSGQGNNNQRGYQARNSQNRPGYSQDRSNWQNRNNGSGNGGQNHWDDTNRECWHCGEKGHVRAKCPKRQNRQGITNLGKNQRAKAQINAFTVDPESLCMMGKGDDVREYVETTIVPGTSERSLLDTGASLNAICPKLLAEYGISDKIQTEQARFVKLADDTLVKIEGSIKIQVNVNGTGHSVNFSVMPDINPKIIYGTPFLADTGILDDFRKAVGKRLDKQSKN